VKPIELANLFWKAVMIDGKDVLWIAYSNQKLFSVLYKMGVD
jgi:hypothetical protein